MSAASSKIMNVLVQMVQNGMQVLAGLAAGGALCIHMVPQTFGLSRYQRFLQLYNNGFPVKLDDHTKQLAYEVFDAMELKDEDAGRVELFVAYGQDMVHKGSVHTRQGGILGVPANFKYRRVEDVERHKVVLNNKHIDWESAAGQMLEESMLLSDQAKRFALAREVLGLRSYHYTVDGVIGGVTVLGTYCLGFFLNKSLRLKAKVPRVARAVIYSGVATLGCLTYVIIADAYNYQQDRKLDRKAGHLGPVFAEGGVEYYTKLLQRNIALRQLLGSSGPKLYTAYGNVTQSWRTPQLSLTAHRHLMVDLMREEVNNDTGLSPQDNPKAA